MRLVYKRRASPPATPANGLGESFQQLRSSQFQFPLVSYGKAQQKFFALGRQSQQDLAAIGLVSQPVYHPACFQAIGQFHRTVVLDLKALRQGGDNGFLSRWQTLNCEQSLVLVRLDSRFARSPFAEIQEAPNFIPEGRQTSVIDLLSHVKLYRTTIHNGEHRSQLALDLAGATMTVETSRKRFE